VTFNPNDTVTYIPKRRVQAEPEISPRDAHAERIIVPNVALLVSCLPKGTSHVTVTLDLAAKCHINNRQGLFKHFGFSP
jgi:hypothetical protein